jgi:hypothetical protein
MINRYGRLAQACLALLAVVYVAGLYDTTSNSVLEDGPT